MATLWVILISSPLCLVSMHSYLATGCAMHHLVVALLGRIPRLGVALLGRIPRLLLGIGVGDPALLGVALRVASGGAVLDH